MVKGFYSASGDNPITGGWGMTIQVAVEDQRQLETLRHMLVFMMADNDIHHSGRISAIDAHKRNVLKGS